MNYSPPGSSVHGDPPGKNTELGCHALLQGIFPTQGSNLGLPHCRLSTKELMVSNCGAGEDSWESLGLQGDKTSQS